MLFLGTNGLTTVNVNAFRGLHNLRNLDLQHNNLTHTLDRQVFSPLGTLMKLNLRQNSFYRHKLYPEDALSRLTDLQTLEIDIFTDFHLGSGFRKLTRLRNLYISGKHGERVSVQNSSFESLENSNISHVVITCKLKQIGVNWLSHLPKIRSLYIGTKHSMGLKDVLKSLYGLQNKTMDALQLRGNYPRFSGDVITLEKEDIAHLKSIYVTKIDLSNNGISSIAQDAILAWTSKSCLKLLDISKNKFDSQKMLHMLVLFPAITHFDATYQIYILKRRRRYLKGNEIIRIPKSLTYLNISHNYLFSMGDDVLRFSEGNELATLDVSFTKGINEKFNTENICSVSKLKGLVRLTELYMSGLDCSVPDSWMFEAMFSLSRIDARHCNISDNVLFNATSVFAGLRNLSYVDLSANKLFNPSPSMFQDQRQSLKTVLFIQNSIQHVPTELLQSLNVLENLDLRHNQITTMTISECTAIDHTRQRSPNFQIQLSGNLLLCNCEHVDSLRWFLTTKSILDKDLLECITMEGNRVRMVQFLDTLDSFQISCVSQIWLMISIVLILFAMIIGTVVLTTWRKSMCLRIWCRTPIDEDIPYDAFIAYSHHDSAWVKQIMKPIMEEEKMNLCLYHRDFEVGGGIADRVMDEIDTSHKVVMVVSHRFIHNEWATYDMALTSMYAFQDGREHRNILILLDDIQSSEMPKVLRRIWNKVVCLKWPTDRNTDECCLAEARDKFWRQFVKCILKGNERPRETHAESTL